MNMIDELAKAICEEYHKSQSGIGECLCSKNGKKPVCFIGFSPARA
jgi:hypothetical protein